MRPTPHYGLVFHEYGNLYSASVARRNMVIIDNQLVALSDIVGDGLLDGWALSCPTGTTPAIRVSPGDGLIGGVYANTLAFKTAELPDNATSFVYMRFRAFNPEIQDEGLRVPYSGPAQPLPIDPATATWSGVVYANTSPPAVPTNFRGQAVFFDTINLFWDENTDNDLDYYEIQRSTDNFATIEETMSPVKTNGIFPDVPYVDTGLKGSTSYYYRIRAVDTGGNKSAWAPAAQVDGTTPQPIVTPADTTRPGDPNDLRLFGGDGHVSVVFEPSIDPEVTSYLVSWQKVDLIGVPFGSISILSETLSTTRFVSGLTNFQRYRITVQSRNGAGNLSVGISSDFSPAVFSAPDEITGLTATPVSGGIKLDWASSPSPSKASYRITVYEGASPEGSAPISAGLNTTKTITGYSMSTEVGQGPFLKLQVDQSYLLRIQTVSSTGRVSPGAFVKGTIIDNVPPRNPNSVFASPGDATVSVTWSHSPSDDVVAYLFAYRVDSGSWTEFSVGYNTSYVLTGVPNGSEVQVRIRAQDDAGLSSSGITSSSVTPVADTTAPPAPTNFRVNISDEQVSVKWQASAADDVAYYEVMRRRIIANNNTSPEENLVIDTSDDPNHPLPVQVINVGLSTSMLDLRLTNGKFYAYNVRAVDDKGNIGTFSETHIAKPDSGINVSGAERRLLAPTDVNSSYDSTTESIRVTWDYWFPTGGPGTGNETVFSGGIASYPSDGPTSFNIYRSSTGPFAGFSLIDSIDSESWEYQDTMGLVDGTEYWYAVSAVRDFADIVVETSSIVPSQSILLGTIQVDHGLCSSVTSQGRIIDQLEATLREEINRRILLHKHSASPVNAASVEASRVMLGMDVYDLIDNCFTFSSTGDDEFVCGGVLSPEAESRYVSLIVDEVTVVERQTTVTQNGVSVPYTYYARDFKLKALDYLPRQAYVIDPRTMTWNAPYVGDFRILVNSEEPSIPFHIDRSQNLIVFQESLPEGSVVTLDGLGFSYYIPIKVDNGFRGARVLIDNIESPSAQIYESNQTVRLSPAADLMSTVVVEVDPAIPDYGASELSRPINLSPNTILDDFENLDGRVFRSSSGAFTEADLVFPIDGEGNRLTGYTLDFDNSSIVFDVPQGIDATVALEIWNKPEVQGTLPSRKVRGVDGSSFTSGQFLHAQLPDISHAGRIKERAYPSFRSLISGDNYTFTDEQGNVGTATTVYAAGLVGNKLLLGTSSGYYRSKFGSVLLSGQDVATIDPNQSAQLLLFNDDVVKALEEASSASGYLDGQVILPGIGTIDYPSMVQLDDGRILVSGGSRGTSAYIYDPGTQSSIEVASMSIAREAHAMVLLPDGRVLVIGGFSSTESCMDAQDFDALPSLPSGGIIGLSQLSSTEIFSATSDTWLTAAMLPSARSYMAAILMDSNSILVAGGVTQANPNGNNMSGYMLQGNQYCDRTAEFTEYESALVYSISGDSWAATGSMTEGGRAIKSGKSNSSPYVNLQETRQVYDVSSGDWSAGLIPDSSVAATTGIEIEEPIKQFLIGVERLFAVGHDTVYVSYDDGEAWTETTGLASVGVVHRIDKAGDSVYAATDLGVYVMSPSTPNAWIQGGLIGAGTTETYDLLPYTLFYPNGQGILASTEIGVFFSSDQAQTWSRVSPEGIEDVRNIEEFGQDVLIITAGQNIWQSNDRGLTWSNLGVYSMIDPATRMLARGSTDLFLGTGSGLYRSTNVMEFSLVDFDLNRNSRLNRVQYLGLLGDDVCVTYDLAVFAIDFSLEASRIAEFSGIVPTVRINGTEQRNGYRYDIGGNEVIFEYKTFSNDMVTLASNYAFYSMSGGPWQAQNPDAAFLVFVNGKRLDDADYSFDSWTGSIVFEEPLTKFDVVTASIYKTYIEDVGSYLHAELEDKMEQEKGLPLSLGRDYSCNILQLGLAMEHNFWERGLERDQYYCYDESFVDRSMNSFLVNSEFLIMGRQDFDRTNSTIDYKEESSQLTIGDSAVVVLSTLLYQNDIIFIGTDSGLFLLDGVPGGTISPALVSVDPPEEFEGPIQDISLAFGDVYVAAKSGIYRLAITNRRVSQWVKNNGAGLPDRVFSVGGIADSLIAATEDGMYYAAFSEDTGYSLWAKASHSDIKGRIELPLLGPATALALNNGKAYAGIGNEVYRSDNGKAWERAYQFSNLQGGLGSGDVSSSSRAVAALTMINTIAVFEDKVYVGTEQGVYSDNGSILFSEVVFELEPINGSDGENNIAINGSTTLVSDSSSELLVAGESPHVFVFRSTSGSTGPVTPNLVQAGEGTAWTKELVQQDIPAVDSIVTLPSGTRVVFAGNSILFG